MAGCCRHPHHYRDERIGHGVDIVHARVRSGRPVRANGLQFLPFNTVYQLAAETADGLLGLADTALLIPDLINYWLTGRAGDGANQRVHDRVCWVSTAPGTGRTDATIGLPDSLFPDIVEPGSTLGPVLPDVRAQLGLDDGVAWSSPSASHDTASAVAAIPHATPIRRLHLLRHLGTGGHRTRPSADRSPMPAAQANFTNEGGADGRSASCTT